MIDRLFLPSGMPSCVLINFLVADPGPGIMDRWRYLVACTEIWDMLPGKPARYEYPNFILCCDGSVSRKHMIEMMQLNKNVWGGLWYSSNRFGEHVFQCSLNVPISYTSEWRASVAKGMLEPHITKYSDCEIEVWG